MLPEKKEFWPDFVKCGGLLPVITQCATTREVLMLAYMNEDAFEQTCRLGEAVYYSRSRNKLWHKGETSGHVQKVREMRLDCDSDTLLLLVDQMGGAACHKGYQSCFYRAYAQQQVSVCCPLVFDPKEVYK